MSVPFRAEGALATLREMEQQPLPSAIACILASAERRADIALASIVTKEALFQPREGIAERHVEDLQRTRKAVGDLDPILVMQVGPETVLLDGHHRLEVYRRTPRPDGTIPARFFAGSLAEALDVAAAENGRTRLPMTLSERTNFAWMRTVLGVGSIASVARAAGIAERTVSTMREARRRIDDKRERALKERKPAPPKPGFYSTWDEAKRAARDEDRAASEDYETAMDTKAKTIADEIYKKHGTALTRSPLLAAIVLERLFGPERIGELQEALQDRCGGPEETDEEPVQDPGF